MAFNDTEIAEHAALIEKHFWATRRPPLHLRDKIREGQRFERQSIELFYVRPAFQDPTRSYEESVAKVTFVRTTGTWRIFWKRADGKWYRYPPHPEAGSLVEALRVINQDASSCFFG